MKFDSGMSKSRRLVESVLRDRGVDLESIRLSAPEGGAAWAMEFGSAAVMIALNPGGSGRPGRLRLVSPIVRMPDELKPELLLRLLELNGNALPGVAFGIINNEVVLVIERSVQGIAARSDLCRAAFYIAEPKPGFLFRLIKE